MVSNKDYVKYKCDCGHDEYKKILCVNDYESSHTHDWLCQCEKCKTIIVLEMMNYNYKTHQFNVLVNR
jgi:hypothetical protein